MKFANLIPSQGNIVIIGGGGKTGLMEILEDEFREAGYPVLTTVTTRLGRGQLPHLTRVEAGSQAEAETAARRSTTERLLLAGPFTPENLTLDKLSGLPLEWFPAVRQALPDENVLLIEADGSAGRPLKCHRDYEPVLPPLPYFTVAVLGLSALTSPWTEAVHRPEILWQHLALPPTEQKSLNPAQVADFVRTAWAGLKPDLIFLNQADVLTEETIPLGRELADRLAAGGFKTAVGSILGRYLW